MTTIQPITQTNRLVTEEGFVSVEFKRYLDMLLQRSGGVLGGSYLPLTFGSAIAWDVDQKPAAYVLLTGNAAMANPTNLTPGKLYSITVIQDATGNRTLTWGSTYKFPSGTAPTLSTGGNAVDEIGFASDGTFMKQIYISKDLR